MVLMAVAVFSQGVGSSIGMMPLKIGYLARHPKITFLTTGTEEVECRQGIFGGATPQIRSSQRRSLLARLHTTVVIGHRSATGAA
jgi:hypothetical protein